jgi:hypothetical protein
VEGEKGAHDELGLRLVQSREERVRVEAPASAQNEVHRHQTLSLFSWAGSCLESMTIREFATLG